MIDFDDAEDFAFMSFLFNGWTGILFAVVALIFLFFACQNEKECETKVCSNGQKARLIENTCGCLEEVK
jgi:agmatine/peptidylarginine deiminase